MYSQDPELIEKLTGVLRVLGITNEPVGEIDRAVRRLYDRFDAVIVDCCDLTAVQLMKAIRSSDNNPRAIIVALTNQATPLNVSPLVNFQIPKPVNWEMAKRTLHAARTLIHRERRMAERSSIRSSVLIALDAKEIGVRMLDISMRGMLVQWTGPLEPNRRIGVRFNLPDTKIAIHCKGRIAWSDDSGQAGIEFLNLSASTAEEMRRWLDARRARRMAAPVRSQPV